MPISIQLKIKIFFFFLSNIKDYTHIYINNTMCNTYHFAFDSPFISRTICKTCRYKSPSKCAPQWGNIYLSVFVVIWYLCWPTAYFDQHFKKWHWHCWNFNLRKEGAKMHLCVESWDRDIRVDWFCTHLFLFFFATGIVALNKVHHQISSGNW